MNIDKFLKSIPPIANKAKEFLESMEPLPTVITAVGVLLILLGSIFGLALTFCGGALVGGATSYHFFKDKTTEEMNAFLKKVLVYGKEFFPTGYDPMYGRNVVGGIMILGSIIFLITGVLTTEFSLIIIGVLGMVGAFAMMGKFPGLKTYIVSLDIPTKLKDARIRLRRILERDNNTRFVFIPLAIIAIFAVSLLFVLVARYESEPFGTNNASNAMHQIEQCVKGKDSDLLEDKYILKAICGTKYQEELPNGTLTGGADFDLAGDHVVFSGHVNTTSVHIVTEFTILVEYDGGEDTKTFRSVWIEPNDKHKFRFRNDEIKNGPDKEDVNTNDFVWKIREIKGVPIIE